MGPLELAIEELEDRVEASKHSTKRGPQHEDMEWYLLRATALGLSFLRECRRRDLGSSPARCENYYRNCAQNFKRVEDPLAPKAEAVADQPLVMEVLNDPR